MSLSDVSDLTELSSDEDDFSPSTSKTTRMGAGKKKTKEYKVSGALRPPRTTSYTARSLYDQIIDNAIDLDPEYQRDVVWPEAKQSGLIDSMLRNYYIPPIIFAVSVTDDGSELRTCIDGKQRLTSIQRFVDGQIPHKDSFTSERLWYKTSATNARRKLLSKHLMNQFANKQIVCIEYSDISGDQEREIFQRVQLGVALTPAERMQAIVGPWPSVIREIQSQVLGEDGFQGYLDWGHARGRDFQCLASIGYLIENHPKPAVPAAPTLEKWLLKNEPVSPKLREDLLDTFRVFLILARDQKYSGSLNSPTRVSPIEFVMIGVLIYLFRDRLSFTQLSSAIEKMRKDVRDSHRDIRANGRVTKHMLLFMSKRLKVSELLSDGKGDKPAAGKPTKPKKRKRPVENEDDRYEEDKGNKLPRKESVSGVPPSTSKSSSKVEANPKPNPVPKDLPPTKSQQNKTSLDSQLPAGRTPKASVPARAPASTPVLPAKSTKISPPSIHSSSVPSNVTISTISAKPSPAPVVDVTCEARPVKSEPHVVPLHSSTASPLPVDRLGPIRVAKEVIRSNSGSQVQSPTTPYPEHRNGGSLPNPEPSGSTLMHGPQRPGPSTTIPPQQGLTPPPNSIGTQPQINSLDVEAILRVHGLLVPQTQQTQTMVPPALPGPNMAAMQAGLNILSRVDTSTPGSSVIPHSHPMQPGVSPNNAGFTIQSAPAMQFLPGVSQTPLYLPGPQNGVSNTTHPNSCHSIPQRPPSTVPKQTNPLPRAEPMTNQPPPYSASSIRSFKDDRPYNNYGRRDYSSYEKDPRRRDPGGQRRSSGYDDRRERERDWEQRGGSWRKA